MIFTWVNASLNVMNLAIYIVPFTWRGLFGIGVILATYCLVFAVSEYRVLPNQARALNSRKTLDGFASHNINNIFQI